MGRSLNPPVKIAIVRKDYPNLFIKDVSFELHEGEGTMFSVFCQSISSIGNLSESENCCL